MAYQPDGLSGTYIETLSRGRLPAYMLSAVIPSEHSYPALPLVEQLVHQRFVLTGPLVLGQAPLKFPRPQQIRTELSYDVLNPARVPF